MSKQSEKTAEEIVRERFPKAYSENSPVYGWRVFSEPVTHPYNTKRLDTQPQADVNEGWINEDHAWETAERNTRPAPAVEDNPEDGRDMTQPCTCAESGWANCGQHITWPREHYRESAVNQKPSAAQAELPPLDHEGEGITGYCEGGYHEECASLTGGCGCKCHAIAQRERQLRQVQAELADEERAHQQTLKERDDAEDALGDAYAYVTGSAPEWSNIFGYEDATNEIAEKVKDLEDHIESAEQKLAVTTEALRYLRDALDAIAKGYAFVQDSEGTCISDYRTTARKALAKADTILAPHKDADKGESSESV